MSQHTPSRFFICEKASYYRRARCSARPRRVSTIQLAPAPPSRSASCKHCKLVIRMVIIRRGAILAWVCMVRTIAPFFTVSIPFSLLFLLLLQNRTTTMIRFVDVCCSFYRFERGFVVMRVNIYHIRFKALMHIYHTNVIKLIYVDDWFM